LTGGLEVEDGHFDPFVARVALFSRTRVNEAMRLPQGVAMASSRSKVRAAVRTLVKTRERPRRRIRRRVDNKGSEKS
jgi:hypothetical protein